MKNILLHSIAAALISSSVCPSAAFAVTPAPQQETAALPADDSSAVRKLLFIGDSMTGWLAERLGAYGALNGFEVATVVWDGSTLTKWSQGGRLQRLLKEQSPDAVFLCLGMNDMFSPAPERQFGTRLSTIREALGATPYVWIGPPSWPGKQQGAAFNDWMEAELGQERYFRSDALDLPRQSRSNPHPTREGMIAWMDSVVEWLPQHTEIELPVAAKPDAKSMKRGKTFIYKRMKETL